MPSAFCDQPTADILGALYTGLGATTTLIGTGDPCNGGTGWTGITCDGTTVTQIFLFNQGLTGTINGDALGCLTDLTSLYLGESRQGFDASCLFEKAFVLTCLFFLFRYADNNKLNGTIPSEIGNLTNLQYLP